MKKLMILLLAVATTAMMSCSKDGDTGPQGAAGTNGIDGQNGNDGQDGQDGQNGQNGNANVKLFIFGPTTFTSSDDNETYSFPPSVTANMLDSSLVLYYHKTLSNGGWYATPGLGSSALYQTRAYTVSATKLFSIEIVEPDGSPYSGSPKTFITIKAIVVPSSDYSGSRAVVDFSNYAATMNHFGLPLD